MFRRAIPQEPHLASRPASGSLADPWGSTDKPAWKLRNLCWTRSPARALLI